MAKIVMLVAIAVIAVVIGVNADDGEGSCGENEFYTPPGKCAPCEVNCGSYVIPCRTRECRSGCQCYLGYKRDANGVCQNAYACGRLPPGAVN